MGRSDRIRVPSPAARTTAERRRSGIAAFLARRNAQRAYGTLVGVPELEAYDEFGLFHENAAEYGLPYDGPPEVRRVDVEVSPGRAVSSLVWGSGPPELVLVHGGAQNAHTWDTVALALGRPLLAVDLPGHGHSDGGPEGSISAGSNGRDLATVIAELAPDARGVVGMSLGGISSIALAATAPELVRALVLVDVTPGVNAEKAAPITNFINGPASFDSFDELLARTIEHNPGRSESSLRRGILHNAVQREDGSWVWRYARFRAEPVGDGRPSRLRRPVGGHLRAHRPDPARARPGLVRGRRRRRRRAAAAPAHGHGHRRRGGGPQHPGRPAARAGRHPVRLPLPRRLMDKKVWLSRRAIKLHVVILIVVPAFLALCLWQISRALGGNTLSWAYVFEWPLFAGYAVYMWWRFVHEAAEDAPPPATAGADPGGANGAAAAPAAAPEETAQEKEEDKEMAAYNDYLAQLAERDKASGR